MHVMPTCASRSAYMAFDCADLNEHWSTMSAAVAIDLVGRHTAREALSLPIPREGPDSAIFWPMPRRSAGAPGCCLSLRFGQAGPAVDVGATVHGSKRWSGAAEEVLSARMLNAGGMARFALVPPMSTVEVCPRRSPSRTFPTLRYEP